MFRNPTADVIVVLVILLLFFGPKRLPQLGKSLGSGIREFKDSITGRSGDDDEDAERPSLTAGATMSSAQEAPAAARPEPTSAQAPRDGS